MKNLLIKITTFGLAGLTALLITEGLLRVTDKSSYNSYQYDFETGLITYRKSFEFKYLKECINNTARTNSSGFHAREFPKGEKGEDEFRIVILGSSYVSALQVPKEKGFPYLLEEYLNENPPGPYTYKVIRIAFGGLGDYNKLQYLNAFGLAYKPDLIIYSLVNGNRLLEDVKRGVIDHHTNEDKIVETPFSQRNSESLLLKLKRFSRNSKLIMNMFRVWVTLNANFKQEVTEVTVSSENADHLNSLNNLLYTFDTIASSTDAELVVFSAFFNEDEQEELNGTTLTRSNLSSALLLTSEKLDINYIDTGKELSSRSKSPEEPISFRCNAHWNEVGHKFVAEELYNNLVPVLSQ